MPGLSVPLRPSVLASGRRVGESDSAPDGLRCERDARRRLGARFRPGRREQEAPALAMLVLGVAVLTHGATELALSSERREECEGAVGQLGEGLGTRHGGFHDVTLSLVRPRRAAAQNASAVRGHEVCVACVERRATCTLHIVATDALEHAACRRVGRAPPRAFAHLREAGAACACSGCSECSGRGGARAEPCGQPEQGGRPARAARASNRRPRAPPPPSQCASP